MKIRLKEIIVKLNEVIKDSKIKVTEDNLFSEACSFLRGEYAGENNFNRRLTCELKKLGLPTLNEQIESMEKATNILNENKPPTEKQIATLKKFKIAIPKTKYEAIHLISEKIEKIRSKNEKEY